MPFTTDHQRLDAICCRIAEGRRSSRQLATAVRRHGLSEAEFRLLWLLRVQTLRAGVPFVEQGELVERLGGSAAQVSSLVEGLRTRKIIEKMPTNKDRRRQRWQLTADGSAEFEAIVEEVDHSSQSWPSMGPNTASPAVRQEEAA